MPGTTMDGESGATVAAHDIARLANVGRAAVSNWRRRFPDFPEPVGGSSASPLYSLAEVESWLTRHGKPFNLLPGDRVWQQVRGAVDDLALGTFVGHLGAFLVFLRREPGRWKSLAVEPDEVVAGRLTELMVEAVPEIPGGLVDRLDDGWVGVVRLVAEAADAQGDRELFDFLCDRYLQAHARRYAAVTPAQLAELMVELAEVRGRTVLDPACGIGTLLIAAHAAGATRVGGQELDPISARLAVTRMLLHDTAVRVVAGDSLRADALADQRADVVLCDPPFNERSWGYEELVSDPRWEYGLPPRGEPELAWVQHCLSLVEPGGRVVLIMPASVANRRAGRRIRGNLLRAGALRAVFSLPGGGAASTVPPDLWVLCRPEKGANPPSQVLLAEAGEDLSAVVRAWRAFRADPDAEAGTDGQSSRSVRIVDLLDDEVDLSPGRHLRGAGVGDGRTQAFPAAATELLGALMALPERLPGLTLRDGSDRRPTTSVGELVRAGMIALYQAPLKMVTDAGQLPVLTLKDLVTGRPPSGRTGSGPGLVEIEPGDVLVPVTSTTPMARVATEPGAILGPQLILLRVDPNQLDPYFLAGFLRAAQSSGGSRTSALLTRTDARRTPIPRLPLAEQREHGEAFRQLTAFADTFREAAALGELLIRLGFTGLADGSLQPPPSRTE
ncbi:N-6 DNA methylase [Plantactinospora sp. B6F1]|uniref:N-6 DNA methylase n=1 Tax=Plantactinospora sp. B6F1 TaxID=3158971 RepID=UPI0032D905DE